METKKMICEKAKECEQAKNCFHGKNHIVCVCDLWNCLEGECAQIGKAICTEVKKHGKV
jgi:hypothetical protein